MRTKILFSLLAAYSFFCVPEVFACQQVILNQVNLNESTGTIIANGIDCASNTSTVWFVDTGADQQVELDYYFNLPAYKGNRLRIYQAATRASCISCISGTPIFDTSPLNADTVYYATGKIKTNNRTGCFVVRYDVAFVLRDYTQHLIINFSGGQTIHENLYVNGALSATDLKISGKVGIGVTHPSEKLHVAGNILADTIKAKEFIWDGPSTMEVDKIIINSGNSNTTTAYAPLHIENASGGITQSGHKMFSSYSTEGASSYGGTRITNNLFVRNFSSAPDDWVLHDGITNGVLSNPYTTSSTWWERFPYSNGKQAWGHGTTTYMTLRDGSLGIGTGTTNPGAKLHVYNNEELGESKGAYKLISTFQGNPKGSSIFKNNLWLRRDEQGNNEATAHLHDGITTEINYYNNPRVSTASWWERSSNGLQMWGHRDTVQMALKNGKLGIGVPIPTERLHVNGNIKADTIKVKKVISEDSGGNFTDLNADNLIVNNKLGVGTTTPRSAIQVHETTMLPAALNSYSEVSNLGIKIKADGSSYKNVISVVRTETGEGASKAKFHDALSSENDNLIPGTSTLTYWERNGENDIQSWGHEGTTYMTLKEGKLGIGIDDPQNKLEVNGNIQASNIYLASATATQNVTRYTNLHTASHALIPSDGFLTGIGSNGSGLVWHRNDTYIRFGTNNTERIRILANGNVGIGKTDPTNKLEVNGVIRAKEVLVEPTGWSDFVFKKEYKLLPLSEVESHINEKGHLPEIPSANEVAENGIGLSEMNAKLLQKVEELTLYVIQLNKEIELLKNNSK